MIKLRNIDPNDPLHPNRTGCQLMLSNTLADHIVADIALSAISPGDLLTIVNDWIPGTGQSIAFQNKAGNAAVMDFTMRVTGETHYGDVVTEDVAAASLAVGANVQSEYAYRRITNIEVIAKSGTGADLLRVGVVGNSTQLRIGLPVVLLTPSSITSGNTVFDNEANNASELISIISQTGALMQLADIDLAKRTVRRAGTTYEPGLHWLQVRMRKVAGRP